MIIELIAKIDDYSVTLVNKETNREFIRIGNKVVPATKVSTTPTETIDYHFNQLLNKSNPPHYVIVEYIVEKGEHIDTDFKV